MRRLSSGALVVGLFVAGVATAGDRLAQRNRTADELVQEALHREIYGQHAERAQLLSAAARLVPDHPLMLWSRGFVRQGDQWNRVTERETWSVADSRWDRYVRERDSALDQVDAQIRLANWCREQGLMDQERAHLTRALFLNPDHSVVRARLGFHRLDGEWWHASELLAAARAFERDRAELAQWRPQVEKWRRSLVERSRTKREHAAQQVREVGDSRVIPALEMILSSQGEALALLVVESLARLGDDRAADSLVRHAVSSPHERVREAAAHAMVLFRPAQYVPQLVSLLRTEVTSQVFVLTDRKGQILYRHLLQSENQSRREQLVLDTVYRRIARPGGDFRQTRGMALGQLNERAQSREVQLARQNEATQRLNERVAWVLNTALGLENPATPAVWWQWWNDYNDLAVSGPKPNKSYEHLDRINVVDEVVEETADDVWIVLEPRLTPYSKEWWIKKLGRTPLRFLRGKGLWSVAGRIYDIPASGWAPVSCLAAGTPVWTRSGPQPIESIRIGDLVLSQDPATGELAFKPVLKTTIRDPQPVVRFEVGRDLIESTGGHPFFVSGDGWTFARNLTSGVQMHTATGPRVIADVSDGTTVETYNLVVADFHTYFIGAEQLLCHDTTIAGPSPAVPGFNTLAND